MTLTYLQLLGDECEAHVLGESATIELPTRTSKDCATPNRFALDFIERSGNTGHESTTLIKYNAWANMPEETDDSVQANRERWPVIPVLPIGWRLPAHKPADHYESRQVMRLREEQAEFV